MSHENPLDLIKAMNAKKEAEKNGTVKQDSELVKQESESIPKEIIDNQANTDQKYASFQENKKVLIEDIEKFQENIKAIKGTREEMISQYHEVINEAKKNPETLVYVKENFLNIFKEGKEKWQELRNELNPLNEAEKIKNEDIKNIDAILAEIYPETSEGKIKIEQEKRMLAAKRQHHEYELERQKELIDRLVENIETGKKQKESYSSILDQKVEYSREQWASGEAKIISEDAIEFTELWKQFPVNPWVISSGDDYMAEKLKEKKYSNKDIENYQKQKEKLNEIRDRIYSSLQIQTNRYINIGFARSNNISYPSFPYISVGHGNYYLDDSLLGKQITLGELYNKDIEIKTGQLSEAQEKYRKLAFTEV